MRNTFQKPFFNLPAHFYLLYILLYLSIPLSAQVPATLPDSITVAVSPQYDSVSGLHRFIFGEGYRKLWAAPVRVKVFRIQEERGGLKILQEGGGLQTKSLRLRDKNGVDWVLRSIQKYPERGLPENLRATVARDILQDQVITSHPFAALTVPPLAKALGIPHSNPQIVYVPDDTAFGVYRTDFANTVLLFEQREPVASFNTENTDKIQRKTEEDNDHRVNQQRVLRARLLDLLLGDWDRHEDQWRWEVLRGANNEVEYLPVPRDRDKVFYSTSGFFPSLLSYKFLKANLQDFSPRIRNVEEYNFNNRYFDRYFLNGLDEKAWQFEIKEVQRLLPDSLIRSAMRLLPDTIYALSGEKITNVLIARRTMLLQEGLKYYRFISKFVDVPATTQNEQLDVQYKTNGNVAVIITKRKRESARDRIIYLREFDPAVTKEIRLYGMAGNNVFNVFGSGASQIKVRLIGGSGSDSFNIDNRMRYKKLFVYDNMHNNNLPSAQQARVYRSADSTINLFNRKRFAYDHEGMLGSVFFNPDQGLLLRLGYIVEKQGFRKTPFASRQIFYANYATTWQSFLFTYVGQFKKLVGKNDLLINLTSRGPSNVDNFFGVGNETAFDNRKDDAIKQYQNRYDYVYGDVRLKRNFLPVASGSVGIGTEFYTSSSGENRNTFLRSYDSANKSERVFFDQFFTGLTAGFEVNSRNHLLMPFKGVHWHTELRAMQQLNGNKNYYGRVFSEFSFYLRLKDSTIIIANRLAGGTTIGEPGFYQQHKLGGPVNLRGYNLNRFTGHSVFYHNIELRMKLFDFTSYLVPGTVGLIGFNDAGRVWAKREMSTKWHNGYGGGFYIVPADLMLIQALVGRSVEGTSTYISVGVRF